MNAFISRLDSWSLHWWNWIVQSGWQAGIVALVVVGLITVGRRGPSPLRHALLLVALLKFALPPMVALPTGLFSRIPSEPVVLAQPAAVPITPVAGVIEATPTEETTASAIASVPMPGLGWQGWLMIGHAITAAAWLAWCVSTTKTTSSSPISRTAS